MTMLRPYAEIHPSIKPLPELIPSPAMSDMQTKNSHPVLLLKDKPIDPLITAYFEWGQLKLLYRQGWLRRDAAASHEAGQHDHGRGTYGPARGREEAMGVRNAH